MKANQAVFPIRTMARVLGVSPAGYYAGAARSPSQHAKADHDLLRRMRTIHALSHGTYGAPRIHAELKAEGLPVGCKRVARLMRRAGLCGVSRRRGPRTTIRDRKDVWSRALMVHSSPWNGRIRYGPNSPWERPDNRGGASSDTT